MTFSSRFWRASLFSIAWTGGRFADGAAAHGFWNWIGWIAIIAIGVACGSSGLHASIEHEIKSEA